MSDLSQLNFSSSRPLTLGVELELQLVSLRDYDLTRAATDLLSGLRYDDRFGEVKLEITESMIEINSRPRIDVTGIAIDLDGLREVLVTSLYVDFDYGIVIAIFASHAERHSPLLMASLRNLWEATVRPGGDDRGQR
ncbi:MAG: hypothetical protein JSR69_14225 [Proteobacteria bacterium]|nr:hypothetical protein [Pseudomonadota bacterium]